MTVNGDKVAELQARADTIARRLQGLYAERRQLALASVEGDKAATGRITQIDREAAVLMGEQNTLASAIEAAQRLARIRGAEIEAADRAQHAAAARKVAAAALAVTQQIDAAMATLTQMLARRATLIREVAKTGIVAPHLTQRLLGKSGPTAAAKAAGLDGFLALELVANGQARSLVDASGALRAASRQPPTSPPPAQPRYRLKADTDELLDAAR